MMLVATSLVACAPNDAPAADGAAGASAAAAPNGPRVMVQGVDVTGVGHDIGDPGAPIVIVELSDFGCPYCAKHALETLPTLEREFVATGKVFYKHVPFVLGMFPNGDRAARSAECAGEQDRFWQMHDSVYVHQREWKRGSDADGLLSSLARKVVPDGDRWAACYAAGRQDGRTAAANSVAARRSVRATPTFFINGQMVEGALPLDVMRQGLNAMLAAPQPSSPSPPVR
jgi:protein-disulfide isomerase